MDGEVNLSIHSCHINDGKETLDVSSLFTNSNIHKFRDITAIQNILFIDTNSVVQYKTLFESVNDCTLAIPYNPNTTTRLDVENMFDSIYLQLKYSRIGFAFTTYGDCVNTFIENLTYNDDEGVNWLIRIIRKYEIKTMDFFGCKTLEYDSWKKIYEALVSNTGVTIYANPGFTGNASDGGNWMLCKFMCLTIYGNEKTIKLRFNDKRDKVYINLIYFNSNIQKYTYLFDGIYNNFFLIDKSGYVWGFGDNTNDSLGQGPGKGTPTFLSKISTAGGDLPANYNTKIVAVGNTTRTTYVSLNQNGQNRLYYVGYNVPGDYVPGMAGTDTSSNFLVCASYNTQVDLSSLSPVVKILGPQITNARFLTASGDVYQSSYNAPYVHGSTPFIVSNRLTRSNTRNVKDVQVAVGTDASNIATTLLLRETGEVIGYGSLMYFGTGTYNNPSNVTNRVVISAGTDGSFNAISLSNTHTMVLNKIGEIYCTGYNTRGQFGNTTASTSALNNTWYKMTLPTLPSTNPPTISTIVAGNNISYILYSDGSLYGCGENTKNQINSNSDASYSSLKFVAPPFRKTIKQVNCMVNSTQILTTDDIPYSVGNDSVYGIGIGSSKFATVFTQMSSSNDRSTLITDVSSIGVSTPITVTQNTPGLPQLSRTTGVLNSLTVIFDATTLSVTDVNLKYYYHLDGSETYNLAGSTGVYSLINSTFTISPVSGTTHVVALVAKTVDACSNVLWSSSVTTDSSSVSPFFADSAPSNLVLTPVSNSTTSILVQFDTPSTTGVPSRTGYKYSLDGVSYGNTSAVTTNGITNSFTISTLTAGTPYTVRVVSVNTSTSPIWQSLDVSGTVTTNKIGTAPSITNVSAVDGNENQLSVYFNDSSGGIPELTKYQYSLSGGAFQDATGTSSPITIGGLTAGTTYTVALKALSGNAWTSLSSTTSASVTTNKIGSAPTFTFNSTTANQVEVSYVQTTTGTTPVLYYYYLNGVKSSSLSSATFSIPSLTNTTANYYSLYILANNAGGDISSNSQYISFVGSVPTGTATSVLNGLSITYSQTTPGTSPTTFYYSYYQDGSNRKGPVTSPFITDSSSNQNVYVVADNSGGVVVSSAITGAPYLRGTAPSISTITPGLNSLTFVYSASIGGNPNTVSYYYSSDGTTLLGTGTTGTSITVTNLNINQTYQYYIIAVGLSGTTEIWRNASAISTATRPYIKGTSPTVTVAPVYNSENSLQVTYGDSSGGNPTVTKYQYYTTPPGSSGLVDVSGAVNNQFTIPGLTANTSYQVTMRALGVVSGTTAWTSDDTTSASVTTNKIGSAPSITNVSAVDGTSNSIRVTFTDPSDGIPSTTKYQYYTTPPGSSGVTDAVVSNGAFTITNLSSGTTYTVTMRSVSSTSWASAYSTTSTSVSTNTLGGPLTVSALNGEGKITVTYSQEIAGTSTTNFFYSLNGGLLTSAPASPFDLSGSALTSTSPYSIYVLARNPAGDISSNAFTGNVFGSKPTMSLLNGEGKITVTYSQAIAGTTGTSFFYSLNGQSLTSAPASPFDLSGSALISTSPYSIYVLARNPAGDISSNATNGNVFGSRPSIDSITKNVGNSITVAFTQSQKGTNTTTYYYSLDGSNVLMDASSSGTPLTIPNLNELTTYSIYVVASNPAGNVFSLASAGVSILGTQPTIDSITKNVGNSITVAFTQYQKGTNTTTYYYSLDGSNVLMDASSSGTPLTIPNLINTSLYSIYVVASNPAGNVFSTVSSNVSIKGTKPTMTLLPVANSSGVLQLTYLQSNTGTAPVSYYYSNNVTGFPRTLITSNPYNITDLSGTTSVYIIANNAAGDVISDASSATPYLLGNNPVVNDITSGINKLTVSFTGSTGANPAPTYYYSLNGGSLTSVPSNQSPFDISGLTQAVSNSVYVLARNTVGDISSNVLTGTPYIIGGAPTITNITAIRGGLSVEFTGSTGGYPSPTTYYYAIDSDSPVNASSTTSPIVIRNLTTVKEYTVRLYAQNSAGLSSASNALTGTPLAGIDTEVITPATYWSLQYWSKPSFWKRSYWSKKRK